MQFKTAAISLFLAAASVQGRPALEERQESGVAYEIVASCPNGQILDSGIWEDPNPDRPGQSDCVDISTPTPGFPGQVGIKITNYNSPKNLTVWNVNGCTAFGNGGNFAEFRPGQTECLTLPARAGQLATAESIQFGTVNPAAPPS